MAKLSTLGLLKYYSFVQTTLIFLFFFLCAFLTTWIASYFVVVGIVRVLVNLPLLVGTIKVKWLSPW